MENKKLENAKIDSWLFKINDFDHLELVIGLKGNSWGVVTSFYTLDSMEKLFDILGIVNIEQLKGSYCRVEFVDCNLLNKIYNILDDEKYYSFRK